MDDGIFTLFLLFGFISGIAINVFVARWVLSDAKDRGKSAGTALSWSIATFLMLIVFLPLWLIMRPKNTHEIVAINRPKLCPNCGKYYEGTPSFCPNCGDKLIEEQSKKKDFNYQETPLDVRPEVHNKNQVVQGKRTLSTLIPKKNTDDSTTLVLVKGFIWTVFLIVTIMIFFFSATAVLDMDKFFTSEAIKNMDEAIVSTAALFDALNEKDYSLYSREEIMEISDKINYDLYSKFGDTLYFFPYSYSAIVDFKKTMINLTNIEYVKKVNRKIIFTNISTVITFLLSIYCSLVLISSRRIKFNGVFSMFLLLFPTLFIFISFSFMFLYPLELSTSEINYLNEPVLLLSPIIMTIAFALFATYIKYKGGSIVNIIKLKSFKK